MKLIDKEILLLKIDSKIEEAQKVFNVAPSSVIGGMIEGYKRIKKIVNYLSKYTFAIYLMHIFIIELSLHFFKFDATSLSYRLFYPFVVVIICVVITNIMRRIPIIRRIVPE